MVDFFLFIYDALLFSIETTHAHTHNNSDNKRIGHHTFVSTSFVSNINVPSYQFKYNDYASIEFHNIGSKSYVFSFHIFLFESIFLNFLSLSLYYYLNLNWWWPNKYHGIMLWKTAEKKKKQYSLSIFLFPWFSLFSLLLLSAFFILIIRSNSINILFWVSGFFFIVFCHDLFVEIFSYFRSDWKSDVVFIFIYFSQMFDVVDFDNNNNKN